jgi:tRNA(Ile)-lysidine synthase
MFDLTPLHNNLKTFCATLGQNPTIIVGLSGGPDSVFLLYLFKAIQKEMGCSIIAAHLNHGWRAEATQDALWCQELCKQLAIPFIAGHANDYPVDKKYQGSAEAIGRKQRQLFFAAVKTQYRAQAIALGHHQDDQIETFFIRLARGSSLTGLHGMAAYDGSYLRPLLSTSKQEILTYLDKHHIAYLTDATNTQDGYLRNRIRKHLVPALDICDPRFSASIISTMEQLANEDAFLQTLAKDAFKKIFNEQKQALQQELLALPDVLLRRVILYWLIDQQVSFTPSTGLLAEIIKFLTTPHGGQHQISSSHTLIKQKGQIWLEFTGR